MEEIFCAELTVKNGGTPLTVADAVIRECNDREWLEDVIYYLKVYVDRTYGGDGNDKE